MIDDELIFGHFPEAKIIHFSTSLWLSTEEYTHLQDEIKINITPELRVPNLILECSSKKWLILMDIAGFNGVIDESRLRELLKAFSPADDMKILFITAFSDMDEFKMFQDRIAWHTSVWISAMPEHFVVFDGARLIGPVSRVEQSKELP